MKIRFGTLEDIPAFVELARTFQVRTRFKDYTFNPERVSSNLRAAIESPRGLHCFIVAEDSESQPVGCLIGCVERHFFSDQVVASIVQYNLLPEKRMGGAGIKMLTAFKKWAESRGAYELAVGINSGTDLKQMDSFLRKLGFQLTGGNYSMVLGGEK
jgi:hypothetical protein